MSDVARLLKMVEERGEFLTLEDGFVYYDPEQRGALSPWMLRAIADELDQRNKAWQAQIDSDPAIGGSPREPLSSNPNFTVGEAIVRLQKAVDSLEPDITIARGAVQGIITYLMRYSDVLARPAPETPAAPSSLRSVIDRIVASAEPSLAKANHVTVHRHLIGELSAWQNDPIGWETQPREGNCPQHGKYVGACCPDCAVSGAPT